MAATKTRSGSKSKSKASASKSSSRSRSRSSSRKATASPASPAAPAEQPAADPQAGQGQEPNLSPQDTSPQPAAADVPGVGTPELYDRKKAAKVKHDVKANVAEQRAPAGDGQRGPREGRVDGQTRRSGVEVLQGHFCSIDRTAKGVSDELARVGALADRDGYGVYLEPAEVDKDGYPKTALVRLRDDTHAIVTVPYDALRPAQAGGR